MPEEEQDAAPENPLHKKLGLRPQTAGAIIAAPEDNANPVLPLPQGFSVLAQADELASLAEELDFMIFFARNRAELARAFNLLRSKLAPGGSLWISWIKQSSGRRSAGPPGDLNENTIRRIALAGGLVDVKVAALDHDWSALKLVRRKQ